MLNVATSKIRMLAYSFFTGTLTTHLLLGTIYRIPLNECGQNQRKHSPPTILSLSASSVVCIVSLGQYKPPNISSQDPIKLETHSKNSKRNKSISTHHAKPRPTINAKIHPPLQAPSAILYATKPDRFLGPADDTRRVDTCEGANEHVEEAAVIDTVDDWLRRIDGFQYNPETLGGGETEGEEEGENEEEDAEGEGARGGDGDGG